jgi:hypothetical protein
MLASDAPSHAASTSILYARARGVALGRAPPGRSMVDHFYSEVQKMGGGRWDTSALMARLDR